MATEQSASWSAALDAFGRAPCDVYEAAVAELRNNSLSCSPYQRPHKSRGSMADLASRGAFVVHDVVVRVICCVGDGGT